jgi:hypothetical protein
MKIILICIFTLCLNPLFLAHAQGKKHLEPALKNKILKTEGFNSSETKRQSHYLPLENKEPAFYSLMAYLHGWETPKSHTKTNELKTIWSKISSGEALSVDEIDIQTYEALVKAKEKYDSLSSDEKRYTLPILSFEPSDLISNMINKGKLNLLNEKELRFYLKLFERKLVDADSDAISAHIFSYIFEFQKEKPVTGLRKESSSKILESIMSLEKEFWARHRDALAKNKEAKLPPSPLKLFAESLSARMSEEVAEYPNTKAATILTGQIRRYKKEIAEINDPILQNPRGTSLSEAINDIESPPKR